MTLKFILFCFHPYKNVLNQNLGGSVLKSNLFLGLYPLRVAAVLHRSTLLVEFRDDKIEGIRHSFYSNRVTQQMV